MQEMGRSAAGEEKETVKETVWGNEALQALLARVQGSVVLPNDADYDESRAVWNGRIDKRPGLIVRAANEADVVACVNAARDFNLPLCVRGAGHHPAGLGTTEGGLVLDMSAMTGIVIDAVARTARIQAGVTTGAFFQAIEAQGLVTTVGSHPTVGMVGLTLGGGMGSLMGRYGLTADSLLAAEIVTADGQCHTASETENPDLLWALRGGGGGFGVVTALTYRLYLAEPVLYGFLIHPIEKAEDVLRFVREFNANPQLPDALTVTTALLTGPGGHPVCLVLPCYTGPLEEGGKWLAPLRAFGPPLMDTIHPAPYSELLGFFADKDPSGSHYSYSCQGLPTLCDDVIEATAAFGAQMTSPLTAVVLYHLHGAVHRVAGDATAFPARDLPYFLGMYTGWLAEETGGAGEPTHRDWHERFQAAVAPHSCGANYPNLTSNAHEPSQVKAWYGANGSRLAAIKAQWDSGSLFQTNPALRIPDVTAS